jgi:hypothetical protein
MPEWEIPYSPSGKQMSAQRKFFRYQKQTSFKEFSTHKFFNKS